MQIEDSLYSFTERINKKAGRICQDVLLTIKYADKRKVIAMDLPFVLFFYAVNKFFFVYNFVHSKVHLNLKITKQRTLAFLLEFKSIHFGANSRNRTGDLLITNQLRYQLRYRSKASVFQSRGVL